MTERMLKHSAVTFGFGYVIALFLVGCSTGTWSNPTWSEDAACFGRTFTDPDVRTEAESFCAEQPKELDRQVLTSRARIANVSGKYNEAFLLYLGACDESLPDSCYQAARLWDQGIVDYVPPALGAYLFQVACENGHARACKHPSQDNTP